MTTLATVDGDTSGSDDTSVLDDSLDFEDFHGAIEHNFAFCHACFSLFAGEKELDDWSRRSQYEFQPSLRVLQQSAEDGCPFCALVLSQAPVDDLARIRTSEPDDDNLSSDQQAIQLSVFYRPEDPDYYDFIKPASFQLQFWFPRQVQPIWINFYEAPTFDYNFDLVGDTSSDDTWNHAQQWLDECITTHIECTPRKPNDRRLPTRLIDIGASGNSDQVCLRNSSDIDPSADYVTLSHCWGNLDLLRLTKDSVSRMETSIPVSKLSKTFQDSITIARRLRERYHTRYLWIDCLCIIQDCEKDWQREASLMGEVYKYALCNIAATAAPDGNYGCFQKRMGDSVTGCSLWIDREGLPTGVFHCVPQDLWKDRVESAPLNRRAWVVQERLLSPRVLHFGADQLYFECCEGCACETCPDGLQGDMAPKSKKLQFSLSPPPYKLAFDFRRSGERSKDHLLKFLRVWQEIVQSYSKGKLTREADKLTALSGLADEMRSRFGEDNEYLAGLWMQDLASQLLWSVTSENRSFSKPITQAPSWSWAAIDAPVLAGSGTRPDEIILVSVLEATVSSNNGFDPVAHGCKGQLRIKGRLVRAEIAEESPRDARFHLRRGYVRQKVPIVCSLDVPTLVRSCDITPHLLPVKYAWNDKSLKGLILEPTQAAKGQFRRCGTFSLSGEDVEVFNDSFGKEEVEHEEFDGVNEFVITII